MKKTSYFFQKSIAFLTAIFVSVIFLGSIAVINGDARILASGSIMSRYSPITMLLTASFSITLVILTCLIFRAIDKYPSRFKCLCLVLCVWFSFCFIILSFFIKPVPMNDSMINLQEAWRNLKGIEINAVDYFAKYTNNTMYVLMLRRVLNCFKFLSPTEIYYALTCVNAVFVLASAVFCYLGIKRFAKRETAYKFLILTMLCPLTYILPFWVYTNTFCMPFIGIQIWTLGCIVKPKCKYTRIIAGIVFAAATVIGAYLRPVVAIPAIAVAICAFIKIIISRNIRYCISSIIAVIITSVVIFIPVNTVINNASATPDTAFPVTHWLMMGSHGMGDYNSEDVEFTESFETKDQKTAANIEKIKENIKSNGIIGNAKLIFTKLAICWSDGSADYTMRMSQDLEYSTVYEFIGGNRADLFLLICQAWRAAILLLGLICVINMIKNKNVSLFRFFIVLSLLGAIIFYIVWEVKQSYSIPFLPFLTLLAVYGADSINRVEITQIKVARAASIAPAAISVAMLVMMFNSFTSSYDLTRYSIYTEKQPYTSYTDEIQESFYAPNDFDTVFLAVKANDTVGEYTFELTKLKKTDQQTVTISFDNTDVTDNGVYLNVGNQESGNYAISCTANQSKTMKFAISSSKSFPLYQGGKNTSVMMNVYKVTNEQYMPAGIYILLCVIIVSIQLIVPCMFFKQNSLLKQVDKERCL